MSQNNNEIPNKTDTNFAWHCTHFSFCPSLGHLYINGKYKHLSPKVSAVFDVLCQHSPNIINKLDILDIVWRNQEISDTAVADAIRTIRHGLQSNKSVLTTVPKQGYRITQELTKINIIEFENLYQNEINLEKNSKNKKINYLILVFIFIGIGLFSWTFNSDKIDSEHSFETDIYNRAIEFYTRFNEKGNDKAIEILQEGIIKYPQSSQLHSALADTYSIIVERYSKTKNNKANKQKALSLAIKATKLDPSLAIGWKSLGFAYKVIGNTKEAKSAYQQAIKIHPNYASALNNLANIERSQGNIAIALEYFMQSLKLNKSDPYIYFDIGNCYRDVGLHGIANQWYLKGMDLKPDIIIVQHDYYLNLIFERKFRQVKSLLDKEQQNKDQEYLDYIALIHSVYSQNTEYAVNQFTKLSIKQLASQLSKNIYAIEMQLVIFQLLNKESETYKFLLNNLNHAQVIWEEITGFKPQPPVDYYFLAHIYANLYQPDKSITMLNTAIDKGFRNIQLLDLQPAFIKLHGNSKFEDTYKELQNMITKERKLVLEISGSNI